MSPQRKRNKDLEAIAMLRTAEALVAKAALPMLTAWKFMLLTGGSPSGAKLTKAERTAALTLVDCAIRVAEQDAEEWPAQPVKKVRRTTRK